MEKVTISEPPATRTCGRKRYIIIGLLCGLILATCCVIGLAVSLQETHTSASLLKEQLKAKGKGESTTPQDHKHGAFKSIMGRYRFAAVSADAKLCSQVGTDILAFNGGSAVDAAIATMLCVGVINFQSAGLGGGAFALVYNNNQSLALKDRVNWFNYRETAPGKASETMFVDDKVSPTQGGMSIGVPGEVKGYYEMHKRLGKIPWKTLFQPAITLARKGFPVGEPLAHGISRKWDDLDKFPILKHAVSNTKGQPLKAGDIIKLPKLANTLRIVANDPDAFYTGQLAKDIVDDLKQQGSIITLDDLANYTVSMRDALSSTIGTDTAFSGPPPSSGAVLHHMIGITNGYKMTQSNIKGKASTILTYHRLAEAMKYAFAKRSRLGDADFINLEALLKNMTSAEYGEDIRLKIDDDKTFPPEHYGAQFQIDKKQGTSHLSVVDKDGNAVAMTSTINLYFGSLVRGRKTGIMFNDIMDDFSTPGKLNSFLVPPSPTNFIKPSKRPMSSMCPTIVVDKNGEVKMVVGASGATRITSATFMVIFRSLVLGQTLGEAVDSARLHHQLVPDKIVYDSTLPEDIRKGLEAKGHTLEHRAAAGVVQAILRQSRYIYGVSDARKYSQSDGY